MNKIDLTQLKAQALETLRSELAQKIMSLPGKFEVGGESLAGKKDGIAWTS